MIGLPVLCPTNFFDILALVAGIAVAGYVCNYVRRNHRVTIGPVLSRGTLLALWYTAVLCIVISLVRIAPCRQSLFVNFSMERKPDVEMDLMERSYETNQWDHIISGVYGRQNGHQWILMLGNDTFPLGWQTFQPIEIDFRNSGTGKYVENMVIDPETLNFTYPSIKTGRSVHGESLDANDILLWFADADVDTGLPHVRPEAEFVAKVIRQKAIGKGYREAETDPMTVFYHVPIGSWRPFRPISTILIGIAAALTLAFWGRRRINSGLGPSPPTEQT